MDSAFTKWFASAIAALSGLVLLCPPTAAQTPDSSFIEEHARESNAEIQRLFDEGALHREIRRVGRNEVIGYFDRNRDLRRIVFNDSSGEGPTLQQILFENGDVLFVLERWPGPDGTHVEHRFYFADGHLVRWIGPQRQMEDLTTLEAQAHEERVLTAVQEFRSAFNRPALGFGYFFSSDRPVAFGLNSIILVAIMFGFFRSGLALWWLQKEWDALQKVAAAVTGMAEDDGKLISHLGENTVVRNQLDLLREMKERSRAIDEGALMALAEERLHNRIATPMFLRSALVLLGLAGTLWGLSLSITDLSRFLSGSVSSIEDMKNAILGTLAGMETAFSTTLAGVAGAILLSFMTRWYEGRKSAFLQRLEHVNLSTLVVSATSSV